MNDSTNEATTRPAAGFTDLEGRHWSVTLTADAVAHVLSCVGTDLAALAHAPPGAGLARLVMMPPDRVREVLWVVCATEARGRGLHIVEFFAALDGFADVVAPDDDPHAGQGREVIVGAVSALAQAVASFWPASPFAESVAVLARGGAAA